MNSITLASDDPIYNNYVGSEPVYYMPVIENDKPLSKITSNSKEGLTNQEISLKELSLENASDNTKPVNIDLKLKNISVTDKKIYSCFACAFVSIILIICAVSVCFAVAFTEISRIRSRSFASSDPTDSESSSITQLNESLYFLSLGLNHDISVIQARTTLEVLGQSQVLPAPSCAAILFINSSSSSGYYWVTSSNGSTVRVYCDMTRSCGNITGGWTRVTSLDMRDNSTQCPSGLRENIIDGTTIRTCVNRNTEASCSSDIFSTYNLPYSSVCGQIRAYQFGSTDAFLAQENYIASNYVDGVSITHGNLTQHIWTFASAFGELSSFSRPVCPCFTTPGSAPPPSFVGEDYFCDTGNPGNPERIFYSDDPLWDGEGCGGPNMCCSFNNPPWFYRSLPQATTNDIEMRVCRNEVGSIEDIAIEIIDFFVQ